MRVPMKKYLFIGARKAQTEFFEKAQKEGVMQFISHSKEKLHHIPKSILELQQAISVLKKQTVKLEQVGLSFAMAPSYVDKILEAKREVENSHEEARLIKAEIVKVHPFGDFNLEDLEAIKDETKKEIQFFFIRHERLSKEEIPSELIFLKREFDFDYYMYIGSQRFSNPYFTEITITRSLGDLTRDLKKAEDLGHERENDLKNYTAYLDTLIDFFMHQMNELNLNFAKNDVDLVLDQYLFAIEAWIPENKVDAIPRLMAALPIYAEEMRVKEGDKIPTYLENKGTAKIGEDLLEVYDVPSITDKDPSPWILWSFALFFGMIVADAGYGIIFFLTALFLRYKTRRSSPLIKRFVKMFTILSIASIAWGILVASYFSIKIDPNNTLNRISMLYPLAIHKAEYNIKNKTPLYEEWVKDYPSIGGSTDAQVVLHKAVKMEDGEITGYPLVEEMYDSILLEIALIVGILHLTLGFFRNLYRSYAGIGWIIMMWGGYLYLPKVLGATTMVHYMNIMSYETSVAIGQQLLYGGLGLAILLNLIQNKWMGFLSIFKVLEIFADTLSYLRLYALGLASMVLGATFNEIAVTMGGYAFGWLIILVGHTINIVLGAGGGMIHGLRLHFLEWFHHCFEGEGYKFNPLRLLHRHH